MLVLLWGCDIFVVFVDGLLDYFEILMCEVIKGLLDGEVIFIDYIDDDGIDVG